MKKLIALLLVVASGQAIAQPTAQKIIDQIKNQVNCQWSSETVDTFKSGNPESPVSGVLCCMFADMTTLEYAVANKCNLIITHEPVYYNHLDETQHLLDDPVLQTKLDYIKEHGLIIWRFHDHWHRHQPDGIYVGILDKLGWSNNVPGDDYHYVSLQEQSLQDLAQYLQDLFQIPGIRVIGNPDMKVSKVGLTLGAPGAQRHIQMLQTDIDVLIAGEAQEWETYQYLNDAKLQGKKKAVIFLGHIKSEEAGMAYMAKWLADFQKEVPVLYLENQVPYWSPN